MYQGLPLERELGFFFSVYFFVLLDFLTICMHYSSGIHL